MNEQDADAGLESLHEAAKPTKKGKKNLLIAGVAVALLGSGTAATLMFTGVKPAAEAAETAYVEIPNMLINIRSADGRQRFLKVGLTLEVTPEAKEHIEAKLPAVIDAMQVFLREIRPEDLAGTSAMFRIKEELLVRADRSVGSGQVSDVLIQELVQQ